MNNEHAAVFVPEAIAYLETCKKSTNKDKYARVLCAPVADALIAFCRQDGEFAQAVAQTKDFDKCLAAVSKGVGDCLSDLDAYSRAAAFYFPGAKVSFQMTLDLVGDAAKPEDVQSPSDWRFRWKTSCEAAMADELFEVRDGELSDDEPFYINPEDERSSYPFTDGELMEDVKRFFRAYIFAKPSREQRGQRVGWCSCCGGFIDEDEMAAAVKAANGGNLVGWHNADAECPQCGRMATVKEDGRMRSYNSLWADGMVAYVYVAAAELVYIRVFDTAVRYGADEPEGEFYPVYKNEIYRCRLRPGEWVCEKNQNWYGAHARFVRAKTPLDEPANKPLGGICGAGRLARSFLRYNRVQDYYDNCGEKTAYNGSYYTDYKAYYPMKYLCRLVEYPQVEMAQKLGLHWAVNELVSDNRKNARLLDWRAATVSGFLRLDRQTTKAYLAAGGRATCLRCIAPARAPLTCRRSMLPFAPPATAQRSLSVRCKAAVCRLCRHGTMSKRKRSRCPTGWTISAARGRWATI